MLLNAALKSSDQLARLHGIWGTGHAARLAEYQQADSGARLLDPIVALLNDKDEEVRSQAAKVLGEGKVERAYSALVAAVRAAVEAGDDVTVITADRGLQTQVEVVGARTMSPGWLLDQIGG